MSYYVAYPVMRLIFLRTGLLAFTVASFVVSLGLIGLNWHVAYFQDLPIALTSVIMLPAWLGGCVLSEMIAKGKKPRLPGNIGWWRLGLWGYATGANLYFYHGGVKMGWPAVLTPFYVFAFFWLVKEIQRFQERGAPAFLEWCGKWSYSLYLIHNIVIFELLDHSGTQTLTWAVRVVAILASSLAFYAAVEYPAHQLARIGARRVAGYHPLDSWRRRYARP
jgi:peptidoglycan/LPS O-acetylase OafA/YrhL